ncbi:MAG: deoxyribodipyrimidine photolyase [Planctomycetota bacterium]|nr:MAG: deoxyribodipyrimidine photolyase [Planctomycetota bacterium]REJ94143.1 MAG: deoxyribodipyrimidine photolyase [Planctomycetota bacterium]
MQIDPQSVVSDVPSLRVRSAHDASVRGDGDYVLYWMIAFRRTEWNFGLQRAVDWARQLNKPLIVLEALRCDYRWASDRLHHFIIQGMADNAARLATTPVTYFPYVERERRRGRGLLAQLAERASVVVSDDYPSFFIPAMVRAAARAVPVCFELIDSNGLLPMRAADKVFARAYDFRRFLQKNLRPHLSEVPHADPLEGLELPRLDELPAEILERWPAADVAAMACDPGYLAELPIDHAVPVAALAGGAVAGQLRLGEFVRERLDRYGTERSEPTRDSASGLSPYLHFGHVSVHQVFAAAMAADEWNVDMTAEKANGSSKGWWGASESVEAFVDELVTWRELGFNMCWQVDNYDKYESLPDWAQATLEEHTADPREYVYTLEEFEAAATHDELWNAAQRQLLREGRIHNYLRMLWGKKILEWSETPQEALEVMIELNNKYALDGRDPNSYSGIFWVLGRYDRAWGPERPIFGKIRYMSSDNTARKYRIDAYVDKYGPETVAE